MAKITLEPGILVQLGPKIIPLNSYGIVGMEVAKFDASIDTTSKVITLDLQFKIDGGEFHTTKFDVEDTDITDGKVAYVGFKAGSTTIDILKDFSIYLKDQVAGETKIDATAFCKFLLAKVGGGAGKVGGGAGE